MRVLVTGGAGFIGRNIVRSLLSRGYQVRVIDNLSPQIHGPDPVEIEWGGAVEFIRADIRDRAAMRNALIDVNKIVHLAAETGTGQSMYEIEKYFSVNVQGTAILLDLLANEKCGEKVTGIVLSSSRAVYGEGAYRCIEHGMVYPKQRMRDLLSNGDFDLYCPSCHSRLNVQKTPESAPYSPNSVYALTKQIQEQSVMMFAESSGLSAFVLRYQNVYGPGQSLKNPYTGILAIFSNLIRQKSDVVIYEDGFESRDFVYVDDVVEGTIRCLNIDRYFNGSINIGTGIPITVFEIAKNIDKYFGGNVKIKIDGSYRVGDIRHNIADITLMKEILDFSPKISFDEGLLSFLTWANTQNVSSLDLYKKSILELSSRNLFIKKNIN